MHRVHVIDFETTDIDPKIARPVEVSIRSADSDTHYLNLINPGIPIPAETSAVHHICDEDVVNAFSWDVVKNHLRGFAKVNPGEPLPVFVAHNAKYDKTVLGEFDPVLWVCTYKCALRIWPNAPAHKNEVLRYHLKLGKRGRNSGSASHSAGHDTQVTKELFLECLKHATLEQLIQWSDEPAKFPRMFFGKHKGQEWNTIPDGYLKWMTSQSDMDPDVVHCAREEQRRRR